MEVVQATVARARLVDRLWLVVLVLGLTSAVATNLVLPDDSPLLDPLYLGWLTVSCVAFFVGVGIWRPEAAVSVGWIATGVGVGLYLVGEVIWLSLARAGRESFPSIADAFYIPGLLVMIVGMFLLVRSRRETIDQTVRLDTAIVSVSAAAIMWTVIIQPYAFDDSVPLVEQLISGSYPVIDVMLITLIARIILGGGRLPRGFILPLVGIGIWTATDITYYRSELGGWYQEWGWIDLGSMVGFIVTGLSTLHPASARVADEPERPAALGRSRVALLAVCAALPLTLLAVSDSVHVDANRTLLSSASALLLVLVVLRTWTVIADNREMTTLRQHARFTSMIRHSSDAILIVDESHEITYASPALTSQWGWLDVDLVGKTLDVILAPDSAGMACEWLQNLLDGEPTTPLEVDWLTGHGMSRTVSMVASDLRGDPDIDGTVLTGRDISHRMQLEDRLRYDAEHDPLTGLANRAAFTKHLEHLIVTGHPTTIAFADIDDFKDINDALGHGVGDSVLVEIGSRLQACLRPGDLVARLGGDEFGIILPDATAAAGDSMARRMIDSVRDPVVVGNNPLQVSLSVGCFEIDGDVDTHEALRNADLAMYDAKRNGKGRASTYSGDMLGRAAHRLAMRSNIATAIANDELHVAYQHIVRMSDGAVVGSEALLRWQPQGRGPIPPCDFIPIAEETGDIVPIGEWVLRTACQDAMDWPIRDGIEPIVSVNVSAVQLDHDYGSTVARALAWSGLPADRLQLELTESLMAEPAAAEAFQQLRELGVRLAIDDFGTGYCSLGYLQRFHVDVIKIDRLLVDGCAADRRLIAGIAGLIHAIGAVAVAEGVEDLADSDVLQDLGIVLGQGFLWHRPTRNPMSPVAVVVAESWPPPVAVS